jgi:hypothetical protein
MRGVAATLLVLALGASPALARELIRFRQADGTLGLVDDPDKLPPGATVLERKSLPELREGSAGPGDAEAPPEASPAAPEARSEPRAGDGGEAAEAARWCERALAVHGAREQAEARRERAEEAYDACRTAGGTVPYCSRRRLDAAEQAVADAERSLERLEDECRSADCLPGWIRAACDRQ